MKSSVPVTFAVLLILGAAVPPDVPRATEPDGRARELRDWVRQLGDLRDQLEEYAAQQARLERLWRHAAGRMQDLQKEHDQLGDEVARLAQGQAELDQGIAALAGDLDRMQAGRAPAATAELQRELDDLRARNAQQAHVLREHQQQVREPPQAPPPEPPTVPSPPESPATPPPPAPPPAAPEAPPATTAAPPPAVTAPAPAEAAVASPEGRRLAYARITAGNRLLRQAQFAAAEEAFRAALALDADVVGARIGLAACGYSRGDLPAAKRWVEETLEMDPHNSQALGLMGIVCWRLGDLSSASEALQQALSLDPNDASLHNYIGIVQHDNGELEGAAESFARALELDPQLAEAHYNRAVVLAEMSPPQLDEARRHYRNAVRLGNPKDPKLEQRLNP